MRLCNTLSRDSALGFGVCTNVSFMIFLIFHWTFEIEDEQTNCNYSSETVKNIILVFDVQY